MGALKKLHEMSRSVEDSDKWVIGGIELANPLKQIMVRSDGEDDEYSTTTPTSAESRIPRRLPCPPAPKKRKPPSSKCHYRTVREFFTPPDLEAVFVRRV